MTKLLQINTVANSGSTGKIAEQIGLEAMATGWESYIAYGRGKPNSKSHLIRIGCDADMYLHGLQSRLLDNHGLASLTATRFLIKRLKEINPDLVHLHNIHGYYLNYPLLFQALREWGGPIVWTLHDCWPMTGHCSHFNSAGCYRWKEECHGCPALDIYPKSILLDRSRRNHRRKKEAFLSVLPQLTMVPVSHWMAGVVRESFLKGARVQVIHNGIDLDIFRPTGEKKRYMLGVANTWDERKGLADIIHLRSMLPSDIGLIIVGLTPAQIRSLPAGITGIQRTENQQQLVRIYSEALAFINPTYNETLSTTSIEAQACGTPSICYDSGGTNETLTEGTGKVVPAGDLPALRDAAYRFLEADPAVTARRCREWAEREFNREDRFKEYLELYNLLILRH